MAAASGSSSAIGARGAALCSLADHGMLAERELCDPGDLQTFCDVLANRLLTTEQAELFHCLALAGDETAQARLVSELGGSVWGTGRGGAGSSAALQSLACGRSAARRPGNRQPPIRMAAMASLMM
jgi:hypothetical protein